MISSEDRASVVGRDVIVTLCGDIFALSHQNPHLQIQQSVSIFLTTTMVIATRRSFWLRAATIWTMLMTARALVPTSMSRIVRSTSRPSAVRLFAGSRKRKDETTKTLEWETFDYSDSPKWDARFGETSSGSSAASLTALNQEELDDAFEKEAEEDRRVAERFDKKAAALKSLSPQLVADATRILTPYINPDRVLRINEVLSQRTSNCRFLFENPANPSNVWACLRTIDSFGVQNVDLVIASEKYQGKAALVQKQGMRTAMGSAQWLTLRNHNSADAAVQKLRSEGYKIYASDLNPNSKDIRDIDWNADDDDRPICIVMGNENIGISEEMRELVDETFTLPMCGFAESFNLSVATAITLAHMSACSTNDSKGPLRPGDMDEHEFNCLRLKGILKSLAQKKAGKFLLKREGIELPQELEWV